MSIRFKFACGFFLLLGVTFKLWLPVFGAANAKKVSQVSQVAPQRGDETSVLPNEIVIKFKSGHFFGNQLTKTGNAHFDKLMTTYQINRLEPVIKNKPRLNKINSSVAIDRIYYAYFSGTESPWVVAGAFKTEASVEYAEPLFRHYLTATPDDPSFAQQTNLRTIQADAAWDIIKGEQGNVVIAIVDGGTDIDHEDLQANIWTNPGEIAGNGIDDDGNGFVDDVHGWNFANDTNDPSGLSTTPASANHGSHTAGVASAVTNNGVGVSGTSWNAKLMPVNAAGSTDDEGVPHAYEGVLYAINNGADIINMSWGRQDGGPSQFEQDVMTVGADAGIALVSSAGNDGNAGLSYPPSYNGVLSVAATDDQDVKAGFSDWGPTVDLAAPGVNIRSTINNNSYGFLTGTSFSSPTVCGVIALVKALIPGYNGFQAGEQVRITADNIDAVVGNETFAGLLGRGRVNAFRAVTETDKPSLRITNITFTDTGVKDNDGVIQAGESVTVSVTFKNYLATATSTNLTLVENDPFITLTSSSATIASLNTLAEQTVTFSLDVSLAAPSGRALNFVVDLDYGSYQDTDRFKLVVEPTFGNVGINNVQVSLTNLGRIGFADPNNSLGGIGFIFNGGNNMLFEGGIICGTSAQRISNSVRAQVVGSTLIFNKDFAGTPDGDLQIGSPGTITDEESIAAFADTRSNTPMNVHVTQESFADSTAPNDDFVLIRYTIENQGSSTLENFHFGFFFDWDIDPNNDNSLTKNNAGYDIARKMGYVFFQANYAGVKFLTEGDMSYRAIDNNGTDFSVNDGFSDDEKWQAISTGIQTISKNNADVSHVIAAGPFTIQPNNFIEVGIALIGGVGITDLRANADAAQNLWGGLFPTVVAENPGPAVPSKFSLKPNYPNPFNPSTSIQYEIARNVAVELTVFNLLGQKIRTLVNENKVAGFYAVNWDGKNDRGLPVSSGVYLYELKAGKDFKQVQKMLLLK